jgi:hypothetical protein
MLLLFILLGAAIGLYASFKAEKDTQTYAAPSLALPAVKFIPQSYSAPRY